MKKHIAIAAGLAVLSTSAFATKARMNALGQGDDRGSFYIQDSRNVFRNASKVNDMTNYVVTEWGSANDAADSATAPHAEGGFFRSAGQFNYGVYLGSDIDNQDLGARTGAAGVFLAQDNNIDLFFGGDMGVKWGVTLGYSSTEAEAAGAVKRENDSMSLGLGVEKGAIEGYVNLGLKDESKGATLTADKWEADTGINVGVSYDWMDYTFFVDYDKTGYEENLAAVKTEQEDTALTIGVGHNHEVSATSRLFTSVHYVSSESETKVTGASKTETSKLPLTIGFEADATSWLALRGSISQNVIIGESKVAGKTTSAANSTDVAAGATLNFGKLKVDGVIGTNGINGTNTGAENGSLDLDRLMTRVAVHYWF